VRDPKAIAMVGTFAAGAKDTPERAAAERAVASLRAARQPVDDFKNLRQEVLDLEKANRDLRKELEDLKKKIEARSAPAPGPRKKSARLPFEPKAH
jgi:predicted  nucleic acid-binding Zn-ribbon protein